MGAEPLLPPCGRSASKFLDSGDFPSRPRRPSLKPFPVLGRNDDSPALQHIDFGSLERFAANKVADVCPRLRRCGFQERPLLIAQPYAQYRRRHDKDIPLPRLYDNDIQERAMSTIFSSRSREMASCSL